MRSAYGAAILTGSGHALYGGVFGRHDYETTTVEIALRGLPATLDGFTIVQLSDLHFGTFVGDAEHRSALALVRRARPDLIVLTGDLVDHDPAHVPALGALVRGLVPLAREGVASILGNHDYYTGGELVLRTLRAAGARTLVNQGRVIGDAGGAFALLGVDDLWRRREGAGPDVDRAIAMVPRDLPRVLLCHQPPYFAECAEKVQLQLSGHTHGGQVNLGFRPADLVLPHGWVAGRYDVGDATLYVNRGFGTAGPPVRVGAPPEVTRIVLVRG